MTADQPWVPKTGLEVIDLEDGRFGVDLLNGTVAIFDILEHAEQYIKQWNTVWRISRE